MAKSVNNPERLRDSSPTEIVQEFESWVASPEGLAAFKKENVALYQLCVWIRILQELERIRERLG